MAELLLALGSMEETMGAAAGFQPVDVQRPLPAVALTVQTLLGKVKASEQLRLRPDQQEHFQDTCMC